MTFDPSAATAAYMAALTPAQHAHATAYTQGSHWLMLWGWLVSVVVAWLVLRSGVLARLSAALQRKRPRPILVSFVLAATWSLLSAVFNLPWALYAGWWREKSYGLANQSWAAWLSESAVQTLIGALIGGVFFVLLYGLMRRAPRAWWVWAGGLGAAFFVFTLFVMPIYVSPLFNKFTPAPQGPIREAVVKLAMANHVPSDQIYVYDGSKQSNRYTANVTGLFGAARIQMSDVMFAKGADVAEVRGVVGHEMGHYVHKHALWLTLGFGILALIGCGLTAALFPFAARWFGAAELGGVANPATLPVFSVVTATLLLLATPLTNTISRAVESDADAYSLTHAQEPDGLAKSLVKTIDYRASSPSRLEEMIFYSHPSVERRVRRAMDWKAAHLAQAEATAREDAALAGSAAPPAPQKLPVA